MRLLRVTTLYDSYLHSFYARRPGLAKAPYAEQRARLDEDAFGWADSWAVALRPLGYEALDVSSNARPLQRAWAYEHAPSAARRDEAAIVAAQARWFRPDVVWYDHDDPALLARIRAEAPSVRGVLGWTGSAIGRTDAWKLIDRMLSCAPEAVERAKAGGLEATVLPHAFDPRNLDRTRRAPPRWAATFIGQLVDGEGFHGARLRLLEATAPRVPLTLFVPRPRHRLRAAARRLLSGRGLHAPGRRLMRDARDGVYGLEMYQVLRDSRVTLNVHADSSPRFASNMRLFEATGVASCLVTDWKENMASIFEPDREAVVYRSEGECAERISWLLEHPEEAAAIGAAGQKRTLAEHTFAHRAAILDRCVRSVLR